MGQRMTCVRCIPILPMDNWRGHGESLTCWRMHNVVATNRSEWREKWRRKIARRDGVKMERKIENKPRTSEGVVHADVCVGVVLKDLYSVIKCVIVSCCRLLWITRRCSKWITSSLVWVYIVQTPSWRWCYAKSDGNSVSSLSSILDLARCGEKIPIIMALPLSSAYYLLAHRSSHCL